GIRDRTVTGVQTCALPISARELTRVESLVTKKGAGLRTLAIVPVKTFAAAKQRLADALARGSRASLAQAMFSDVLAALTRTNGRSEERRVGKEEGFGVRGE